MKNSSIYLLGLTGGVACGKSTVLTLLEELGAQTLDADQVTHRVQVPGTPVYAQILAAFGPEIVPAPGAPIDRRHLGALVFSDPARLRELEQIVHPAVRTEIRAFLDTAGTGTPPPGFAHPVVVLDAIKLIESGWINECDQVWVVTCPEDQQIARLMATRGFNEAEARQRVTAQIPQANRLPYATVVIDNSGTLAELRAQVGAAWATALP
ncbi:dephospho-CoA kinase [Candidatus Chloroploca asiatica]|uniref:Dephospho-CoA kinase n=1 Tax=Candidatus Chloroploca asiatica TaxID=1506545 RepID=A0A2H3KU49_9CHLR|nr:dephospho-CoA kinase [Candidatus Chloroploca asiatica]PDV97392.1 dephospho-CoA kinase [Candidatus Chloroploca asiatica]